MVKHTWLRLKCIQGPCKYHPQCPSSTQAVCSHYSEGNGMQTQICCEAGLPGTHPEVHIYLTLFSTLLRGFSCPKTGRQAAGLGDSTRVGRKWWRIPREPRSWLRCALPWNSWSEDWYMDLFQPSSLTSRMLYGMKEQTWGACLFGCKDVVSIYMGLQKRKSWIMVRKEARTGNSKRERGEERRRGRGGKKRGGRKAGGQERGGKGRDVRGREAKQVREASFMRSFKTLPRFSVFWIPCKSCCNIFTAWYYHNFFLSRGMAWILSPMSSKSRGSPRLQGVLRGSWLYIVKKESRRGTSRMCLTLWRSLSSQQTLLWIPCSSLGIIRSQGWYQILQYRFSLIYAAVISQQTHHNRKAPEVKDLSNMPTLAKHCCLATKYTAQSAVYLMTHMCLMGATVHHYCSAL